MMKRITGAALALLISLCAFRDESNEVEFVRDNLEYAGKQIRLMLKEAEGASFPRTVNAMEK